MKRVVHIVAPGGRKWRSHTRCGLAKGDVPLGDYVVLTKTGVDAFVALGYPPCELCALLALDAEAAEVTEAEEALEGLLGLRQRGRR